MRRRQTFDPTQKRSGSQSALKTTPRFADAYEPSMFSQHRTPAAARMRVITWTTLMVVLPALLLRLAFWWLQAQSGAVQPADPEEYYRAALHILRGGYDDAGKWLRPPLYPAFLAAMLWLGNMHVSLALLGQAIVAGLSTLAFVLSGWWLFHRLELALLSGLLAALFVPLASFGSVLFAEVLFVPLIVLALALLDRVLVTRTARIALLCGLVLGLAALTRAVALFFIPLSVLLVFVIRLPRGEERTRTVRNRHFTSLMLAVTLTLGSALVIGPWTFRNYLVHDRLILVDTNGGISMWYGMVQGEEDKRQGEARLAAVENPADRQQLALQMTMARIQADPELFLTRMRYKVASLFALQLRNFATGELVTISPQDELVATGAGEDPLNLTLIADAQYLLITLLGIFGLSFAPSWRRALPTLLWFIFGILLSAITVAHPRLRLPLVCALIPFSAYALFKLPTALRRPWQSLRQRRAIPALVGSLLFLALAFSTRYLPWMAGEWHSLPARRAMERGNYARAQELFEQARSVDPGNALRLVDLGDLAFEQGQFEAAADWYRQASAIEHRNLYSHAMQIQTATLRDSPPDAQAGLQAIDSYGRDNNDLYMWAWENAHTPPPARVMPGDPAALGHFAGFAPATFDLPQGRWTLGHGRVRLQGACSEVRMQLRGPAGRTARIWVAGTELRRQVELTGELQTVVLSLGNVFGCEENTPTVVHIQSDRHLLDLERAPWYVGVAVVSVEMTD